MKVHKYLRYVFFIAGLIVCGTKANAEVGVKACDRHQSTINQNIKTSTDIKLIKNVYYKFVFGFETKGNDHPADYFTPNALKKLRDDYEFDCDNEPCYGYYVLRTAHQDSKPDSADISRVCSVEATGGGWYIVSYLDMGWSGKTRIKIADGKIDAYEPVTSDF